MSGRLASKVSIITGAASGIGRETALKFAREGALLVLADLDQEATEKVAEAARRHGIDAVAARLDVTDREDVAAVVGTALDRFGRIDALVNSAGVSRRSVPEEASFDEAWDRIMAVNAKGTLLMCHAVCEPMVANGGGAIVNIGSIMSLVVHDHENGLSDGFNGYSHSKGAVVQITRDMGTQYGARGIRVNAVCPGYVYTALTEGITANNQLHQNLIDRHPMRRLGEPADIANVVAFLASDEAGFVNAAAWPVDGGYTAI